MSKAIGRSVRLRERFSYIEDARRPLHSLIFLLPLILAYEIGAARLDPSTSFVQSDRVIAYHLMELFFSVLGAAGIILPGFLIIAILLITHIVSRDRWTVRTATLLGMMGESLVWTAPLFLLNRFIRYTALEQSSPTAWLDNVIISTGAGVYEELIFRLILVTAIVILLEDVLKLKQRRALIVAVVLAAVLFAAHHHQPLGRESYEFGRFAFRTMAGVYLGALFLLRGYGITAGCHAVYNVIVVTLEALSD